LTAISNKQFLNCNRILVATFYIPEIKIAVTTDEYVRLSKCPAVISIVILVLSERTMEVNKKAAFNDENIRLIITCVNNINFLYETQNSVIISALVL
jgi:hypothetical protein